MNKPVLISIIGILAVVVAIALNFALKWDDDEQVRRGPAERPAMTAQGTTKGTAKAPTPVKPDDHADGPSFDVVRINPQGDAVMAGRAKPGARVEIYEGDTKIGEVEADRRGEWVFVPEQPLAPGNRRLSLTAREKDGTTTPGTADVVIVVPDRKDGAQALAMRVPREGQPGSVEILQKPADAPAAPAAEKGPSLAVDAVDYDAEGKLEIVGKAPPGSLVQLYLNNEFLGRTQANERGQWSLRPANPATAGNHTLRADQVEKDGKVTARLEVHFARSEPLKQMEPGALVVVREGNSLWRIARRTYGTGFRYTSIFEANRDQIKNADLIYPGQVFKLPQMN